MVLVDTSVWIASFDPRNPLRIADHVPEEEVATCPPVILEVLQGMRFERAYHVARESLLSMPILEPAMSVAVFEEAAQLFRMCRGKGVTVRSSTDCLVAVCAIRNNVPVLHRGRDFELIARFTALRARSI